MLIQKRKGWNITRNQAYRQPISCGQPRCIELASWQGVFERKLNSKEPITRDFN